MMFRIVLHLCLVSFASAVTLAICNEYCASVMGGPNYLNCSPWNSFATHPNQTYPDDRVFNREYGREDDVVISKVEPSSTVLPSTTEPIPQDPLEYEPPLLQFYHNHSKEICQTITYLLIITAVAIWSRGVYLTGRSHGRNGVRCEECVTLTNRAETAETRLAAANTVIALMVQQLQKIRRPTEKINGALHEMIRDGLRSLTIGRYQDYVAEIRNALSAAPTTTTSFISIIGTWKSAAALFFVMASNLIICVKQSETLVGQTFGQALFLRFA